MPTAKIRGSNIVYDMLGKDASFTLKGKAARLQRVERVETPETVPAEKES